MMEQKLDILVLVAHPDDAELGCGGTLALHTKLGYKCGVADFTKGELGTRGTPETRRAEAAAAAGILGLAVRENLGFADGFFVNDREHQTEVVKLIRRYRPEIVLANAVDDRHPDHPRGAALAVEACFKSGLKMLETKVGGVFQEAWRPKKIFHIIQSQHITPDLLVDVSTTWDIKIAAVRAFATQFHTPGSVPSGDQTFISSPAFMDFLEGRGREWGHLIGCQYAEGFTKGQPIALDNLFNLA